MDIISTKIQKVPKPVSNQTQQNLTAATKILNLYFLIATINLFKLSNFWFIFFFYFVLFQVTLGHLRSFEVGVGEQGHRKPRRLCLVLVRPNRQTMDSIFSENLDRIRTADRIETDRIRTDRHRTVNPDIKSGQNSDSRQTPDRIFRKIRTEMRPITTFWPIINYLS